MTGDKSFRINGKIVYAEDIAKDIIKRMQKNKLNDYPTWFLTFLKMKEPAQDTISYEWNHWIKIRGWLRRAIDKYFVENNLPYWLQIIPKKGYILRSGNNVAPSIIAERIRKGHNATKTSSFICKGISKSSLSKKDTRMLKTAKSRFFDVIVDMHVGRAARINLPSGQLKALMPSKVNKNED
ncbi:MAG TPA: hypothetical protein VMX17_00070 [Candidatus Glassbacteria bacterium]|nr:hypothetical protein [Candidatus Glassbacteria bacterium]